MSKMSNYVKTKNTIVIFFPFEINHINCGYLFGDFESFNSEIKIFFTTKLYNTLEPRNSFGLFKSLEWDGNEEKFEVLTDWIYVEVIKNVLSIKKLKVQGELKDVNSYHILWINYNFQAFSQCEILSTENFGAYSKKSYFKYFKEKLNIKVNYEKSKQVSQTNQIRTFFFNLLYASLFKLCSYCPDIPLIKYFNIALHIRSYLGGFVWAATSFKEKKKLDIKIMNFILSVILDMLLGILFLKWLNSKVSLDSTPTLFLLTAESVVNSIKDIINWLKGDPAGLKLNWAFNKVLATFFSFHIDIWWTFLAFLKPLVKIIFQIFIKLGFLGISFQASITADLLALVSFHVYCIYAYAAKLYRIQLSTLISLWRLFLGRKKNPLREKVDSCRYSPEQLFVGTLGFTILLFLLPTTLLYYIVFSCIRLSILTAGAILMLIRYLNQTLPVYSTILWFLRSSKISTGVEIALNNEFIKSDLIILTVKPVTYSWWETITYFTPDCITKPTGFKFSDILNSFLRGNLIYPM